MTAENMQEQVRILETGGAAGKMMVEIVVFLTDKLKVINSWRMPI